MEKEKGKAEKRKKNAKKTQRETLLRGKGEIRPQSFRKCHLIWTGAVQGMKEDQSKALSLPFRINFFLLFHVLVFSGSISHIFFRYTDSSVWAEGEKLTA